MPLCHQGDFPNFGPPLRKEARPLLTLSMPRLCSFVEQITLPRPVESPLAYGPEGSRSREERSSVVRRAHPTSELPRRPPHYAP